MRRSILKPIIICFVALLPLIATSQSKKSNHPRIYNNDESRQEFLNSVENTAWKLDYIEKKKKHVEKYIQLCNEDSEWLVSRLQMNWKTKHNNVYLKGGNFSHSDGEAPVPTVRFSGTRDWATDYKKPALENIEPYFDDPRGYYLEHKETGKKEWVHPAKTGHTIEGINRSILSIVEDAAFLYWLTGEEKYAKLATPVFNTYIDGMYHRNAPEVIDDSNQRFITGLATFEVIHEKALIHLALAYDYLYNYLEQNKQDLSNTNAVFQKWGDQIIKFGIPNNNWNLFQARFITYVALVLDDDENYENGKGQQYYLKYTFDESTPRQIAIKDALLVYDQETGIWPESPSYSMHVNTTLLEILALLDNATNANELSNFPIIEKAALACFQYLFPSGNSVGFGDSGHGVIPFENFELLIANYRKYHNKAQEALMTSLLEPSISNGAYKRKAKDLFQLNFYVNQLQIDESSSANNTASLVSPTFYAPNVSWFAQRMGSGDKAVMLSTVGSYGNHAHANGIAIELFANNYVHAPDMGRGKSYWSDDFKEYYSQLPAHNTVVVDGKSTYANMRSYHPFSLDNHFPISGSQNPLFKEVTFSIVSFFEPKTKANQQRLSAIVNTPNEGAYVIDVFRSAKNTNEAQKHEYFYHNLGHEFHVYDASDELLNLKKTKDLTSADGQLKAYDYLSNKMAVEYNKDIKAVFNIQEDGKPDNLMKLWVKGNESQTVYTVDSPKSNAITKASGTAPKSLHGKEMPTLILKRDEAAWTNPFVVLFNPYFEGVNNPIKNVEFGTVAHSSGAQKVMVSHTDEATTDHIVATTSSVDVVSEKGFYQKGLLSIVRQKETLDIPQFIFAAGIFQMKYNDWEITAVNTPATVSIENKEDGLWIQNDEPVLIKVPMSDKFNPETIRLYHNDGTYTDRKGNIDRNNPNQIEFRLEKAFEKALISY